MRAARLIIAAAVLFGLAGVAGCGGSGTTTSGGRTAPAPEDRDQDGRSPVVSGEPIEVAALTGRIVYDDFENLLSPERRRG